MLSMRVKQKGNSRPGELDGDGDAVRAGVVAVLGRVGDTGREEETDGDAELVAGHDGATDFTGGDLGHVEDDDGGDEADTKPSDESSSDKLSPTSAGKTRSSRSETHETETVRGGLEGTSDEEDATSGDDGGPPTNPVGDITGDDRAKERSSREDRDDEGRLRGRDGELCLWGGRRRGQPGDHGDEIFHPEHTANVSRVEAESIVSWMRTGRGASRIELTRRRYRQRRQRRRASTPSW